MKVLSIALLASFILLLNSCKPKTTTATGSALPVLSAADIKTITDREISTWEFGKTKNFAGLQAILAEDYVAYFGKSTMNESDVVRTFQNSIVKSYHLSNIKVKPVSADVAIIYYELEQDVLDENGDKWTPYVAASDTYVKRDNVWRAVFYQETEIKN